MQRTLNTPNSANGGPTLIAQGLAGQNTIFVTVNDANNDVYFAHSRSSLMIPRPTDGGIQGFKIAKATSSQIQDWTGDLWAAGSAEGTNADIEVMQK